MCRSQMQALDRVQGAQHWLLAGGHTSNPRAGSDAQRGQPSGCCCGCPLISEVMSYLTKGSQEVGSYGKLQRHLKNAV